LCVLVGNELLSQTSFARGEILINLLIKALFTANPGRRGAAAICFYDI
jgi:hypothetical protein